jgi:hypothetical protein
MTLYGIDISPFQAGLTLDKVKAQGYTFVTARVLSFPEISGTVHMVADPSYASFRDQAKKQGLLFAAYVMVHTQYTPAQHAALIASVIGDRNIPIMLDWESDGVPSVPSFAFVLQCFDELVKRGLRVADLYAPHWYWQRMGSPALNVRGWALTNSNYGANAAGYASALYPGDNSTGWAGFGGLPVTKLQFGSRGRLDGYGGNVDVNAYRGTLAQLKALHLFTDWSTPVAQPTSTPGNVWDDRLVAEDTISVHTAAYWLVHPNTVLAEVLANQQHIMASLAAIENKLGL